MSKINVLVCEPGGKMEIREIDNTLEAMQEIVGGYIEVIPLGGDAGLVCVCNEEGKLMGLPTSINVWNEPVAGTCFICKDAGEEFGSITE